MCFSCCALFNLLCMSVRLLIAFAMQWISCRKNIKLDVTNVRHVATVTYEK